jgi:hypothetical protein
MGNLIDIYDGGIRNHQGHKVGVIIFKITKNVSTPEEIIGYCHPNFRDSIIKNLKRLNFQKVISDENDTGRDSNP